MVRIEIAMETLRCKNATFCLTSFTKYAIDGSKAALFERRSLNRQIHRSTG